MQPTDPLPPDNPDFLDTLLLSAFACERSNVLSEPGEGDALPIPERLGEFRVIRRLGMGGVGEVYEVVDPSLGRTVALKVLKARSALHDHLLESFLEEARLAGSLEHPGIVPLHEYGTLPDGRPYFTMRIISGRTLAEELRDSEKGEASRGRFLEILIAVAKTLAFAHARGVVHGDVKPHNVMVGSFGEVQLIDWGFARAMRQTADPDARDATDSASGTRVIGTPAYMAPEQARGEHARIDARTDVFGLGAILGEILTGEPPNLGSSRSETVRIATESSHEDITARLAACGADTELVELARACLSPEPDRRPSDASAVVASIAKYLAGVTDRIRRAELAAVRATAVAAHERRIRSLVMALAATLLALVTTVGYVWLRLQRERDQRRAAVDIEATREIEDARSAVARAKDSPSRLERAPWDRAHDAALRAVAFTKANEVDADISSAAANIESLVAREIDRNEIASRTLSRLEELHHRSLDDKDASRLEEEFARTFRDHGIDFATKSPDEIAASIRSDIIADSLVVGLDNWARLRRAARRSDWTTLADLAIACESDPWRLDVRRARRSGDSSALLGIAAREDTNSQPAVCRLLLARSLLEAGERDAALAVFKSARIDHPEDYWICHDYATALSNDTSPRIEEVIRLYWMANSLRPNDVHTLVDLGRALSIAKDFETASVLLERAVATDPRAGRAWLVLSSVRSLLGQNEQGGAAARQAFELGEPAAGLTVADSYVVQGRVSKAIEIMRSMVAAYPTDPVILNMLGRLLVETFDIRGAASQFDLALRSDPQNLEAAAVRAYCALQLGDPTSAIERLEAVRSAALARGQQSIVEDTKRFLDVAIDANRVKALLDGSNTMAEEQLFGDEVRSSQVFSNLLALVTIDRSRLAVQATEALLRRPGSANGYGLRFTGARAAARLALGEGHDAVGMTIAERSAMRRRATEWLAADLDRIESSRDASTITKKQLRALLDSWRAEPSLARLDSLELPGETDSLTPWKQTWSRIERLRSSVEKDD